MRKEEVAVLRPGMRVRKGRIELVISAITCDPDTNQVYAAAVSHADLRIEITSRGFAVSLPHEVICDERGSDKFTVAVFRQRKHARIGNIVCNANCDEWERMS